MHGVIDFSLAAECTYLLGWVSTVRRATFDGSHATTFVVSGAHGDQRDYLRLLAKSLIAGVNAILLCIAGVQVNPYSWNRLESSSTFVCFSAIFVREKSLKCI